MSLLNIDKIIINRTIVGINCTSCGGALKAIDKKSFTGKFIKAISFGTIKPKNYQCEYCGKRFMLI
ncbi:MAG: hypothetical protein ABI723_20195 [Bacteroidia bacterium]